MAWCLALALPVQGVASTTMLHGKQQPGGMSGLEAAALGHHTTRDASMVEGHHGAGAGSPCHMTVDSAGDPSVGSAVDSYDAADDAAHHGACKCSGCCTCCVGAALPGVSPTLSLPDLAPSAFLEPEHAIAAMASKGPDRPPRR